MTVLERDRGLAPHLTLQDRGSLVLSQTLTLAISLDGRLRSLYLSVSDDCHTFLSRLRRVGDLGRPSDPHMSRASFIPFFLGDRL